MKVGDLVEVCDGIGIILAYHKKYDNERSGYPWYVWVNGTVKYYQTKNLGSV